jgi:TrmH family RNA methyltransferase
MGKPVATAGFSFNRYSFMLITSKESRIYKQIQRLTRKKYRDREGLFLAEGRKNVREAVLCGAEARAFFLREEAELPDGLPEETPVYILKKELFDTISDTEESQGIGAVFRKPDCSPERLIREDRPGGNIVVLDRLQDPGNVGTILRTAVGAGYEAVVVITGTCDIFSPKVVRAAAGNLFRIPVVLVGDGREMETLIRKLGKKLAVTSVSDDKETRHYADAELTENVALVIGNEGNGVSPEILDHAEVRVRIPMLGGLESLNAAVAAGILMYEAVRAGAGVN